MTLEIIHCDYAAYPNIRRWLAAMKERPSWTKIHGPFYQYLVDPAKDHRFEVV